MDRRLTARTVQEEAAMERTIQRAETITFIHRVRSDASRVITLIEGGLLIEARHMAAGLEHAAGRRLSQVIATDDEDAA